MSCGVRKTRRRGRLGEGRGWLEGVATQGVFRVGGGPARHFTPQTRRRIYYFTLRLAGVSQPHLPAPTFGAAAHEVYGLLVIARRRKNAEAQTWKKQLGSFGSRARLHGNELFLRSP